MNEDTMKKPMRIKDQNITSTSVNRGGVKQQKDSANLLPHRKFISSKATSMKIPRQNFTSTLYSQVKKTSLKFPFNR